MAIRVPSGGPHGQVIDVYVSRRRNIAAARRFFETMLEGRERPREVTTDLAAPLLHVVDDLLPEVLHDTTQYATDEIVNPFASDLGVASGRLRVRRRVRRVRRGLSPRRVAA